MELNWDDPVERIFIECVEVYRERAKKYTHGRWDDNFQYMAARMRESGHPDFKASDAASVLMYVKEARQHAAEKSGRFEFADDSFRDSDLDKLNYLALRRALRDQEQSK